MSSKRGRPPLPPEHDCPCGCGYRQPKRIESEWDKWREKQKQREADSFHPPVWADQAFHEHKFKGGPPPKRLHRMCLAHEGRARRKGLPWHTIDLRHVYKHYEGKCGICEQPVPIEEVTIDHILAIERGGGHVFENLQPAHKDCNTRKGAR